MINLFEILDRSHAGEKIKEEKQWDLRVWKKAVELKRDYHITYDPKYAIVTDDRMADACFEAAVMLLSEVGVLNVGTQRVVRFDEEEIRKGLGQRKDELIVGEGRDRLRLERRSVDACTPVRVMAGHFACTDDVGPKLISMGNMPAGRWRDWFTKPLRRGTRSHRLERQSHERGGRECIYSFTQHPPIPLQ